MTTSEEILLMKKKFAEEHGGEEANVLYVSDPKWREWWTELARVGNPHVNDKLALAVSRKGFAAMKGQIWQGMRVERLNPSNQPQYRTFVDRIADVNSPATDVSADKPEEDVDFKAGGSTAVAAASVAKVNASAEKASGRRRKPAQHAK